MPKSDKVARATRAPKIRTLAKLTRPTLRGAVTRERLFDLLDRAQQDRSICYVVGPPGSGKTTLVASWLEARSLKGIWYQVDFGDADLATFFYYLAQAVAPFSRKSRRPLQLLTPEHLANAEEFSRRFFRELFSRLPVDGTLVLDNYQEIYPERQFHELIAQAVDEVPPGNTLIIISRLNPPDCYARLVTNGSLVFVDWDALKLTLSEAQAMAVKHGIAQYAQVEELHRRTEGWVGGMVLAMEQLGDKPGGASHQLIQDATFNYFANEVFKRLPHDTREFLLQTSFLPYVPVALAQTLTHHSGSALILEDLYRRHLFTHRKPTEIPTYWYHALFQEFLQTQSLGEYSTEQIRQLQFRICVLLDAYGDFDSAVRGFVSLQAWKEAELLITANAATLLSQGRWKTLLEWIEILPATWLERNRWLLYWLGIAQLATSPGEARKTLERSFETAKLEGDLICQARAAAGVIQSHILEYVRFRDLDQWIDNLSSAMSGIVEFPDQDSEAQTQSMLLMAMCYRKPDHPSIDSCAQRVVELLPSVRDVNVRLAAASNVLGWGSLTGPIETARQVLPTVMSILPLPGITSLNAAFSWFLVSWHHCLTGDAALCLAGIQQLERIAEEDGLSAGSAFACVIRALLEQHAGNLVQAQIWSERLTKLVNPNVSHSRASSDGIKAWLALVNNEPDVGLEYAESAVAIFDEIGSIHHQVCYRLAVVWSHVLCGKFVAAKLCISQTRELSRPIRASWQEIILRAAESHMAIEQGDANEAQQRVEATFKLSRESGSDFALGLHIRSWAPRLCGVALRAGIEKEHVRQLIRRFCWSAPEDAPDNWPWPVRIFVLGQFDLQVEGGPPPFSRKVPRKVLALLAVLVAMGGTAVSEQRVVDALWADAEGDAASRALSTMIRRLRTLLGHRESVLYRGGKLSLNAQYCSIDSWEFEKLLQLDDLPSIEKAINLYRGNFLATDDESTWAIPIREKLRGKFISAVLQLSESLERKNLPDRALDYYVRGLQADPLVEPFYQGMMRCYTRLGRYVEVASTYVRLRTLLRSNLGTDPSPSTENLYRTLISRQ